MENLLLNFLPQSSRVEAIVKFVELMNNFLNILSSRNLLQLAYKKPLSMNDCSEIETFLIIADEYINKLKAHVGSKLIVNSARPIGFLGLKICISSFKTLCNELIVIETLKFLPFYKFSQDYLKLFFSTIRFKGGYNDNPSARGF